MDGTASRRGTSLATACTTTTPSSTEIRQCGELPTVWQKPNRPIEICVVKLISFDEETVCLPQKNYQPFLWQESDVTSCVWKNKNDFVSTVRIYLLSNFLNWKVIIFSTALESTSIGRKNLAIRSVVHELPILFKLHLDSDPDMRSKDNFFMSSEVSFFSKISLAEIHQQKTGKCLRNVKHTSHRYPASNNLISLDCYS